MKKKTAKGYILNAAVIAAIIVAFAFIRSASSGNETFKLILVPSLWQCCYLIILAASLNLVLGFLGQLSLGHCGFMAIGAYT
ncbi:MAG: branched-chain amino acid ABC transporter permease, partial [Oscillospiraceae bacterium]